MARVQRSPVSNYGPVTYAIRLFETLMSVSCAYRLDAAEIMLVSSLLFSLAVLASTCSSVAQAWTTFSVPHVDGQDDTPALMTAMSSSSLSANATILFEKGITYNIFTPIKFPSLRNVEIAIEGNLTYPDDITSVQGMS